MNAFEFEKTILKNRLKIIETLEEMRESDAGLMEYEEFFLNPAHEHVMTMGELIETLKNLKSLMDRLSGSEFSR